MNFFKKFFKKKKEKAIKKEEEKQEKKEMVLLKKEVVGKPIKKGIIPQVLKSPHIAEKSSYLAKQNQYVFRVYPKANKTEIKKAIEKIYGVKVIKVRIINIPPKRRKLGRTLGWRQGYKKAVVFLKKGQEIEVLPR